MFLKLFFGLKGAGLPVSLREHLGLLEAMQAHLALFDIDAFYFLARTCLVKDERYLDRFDRVFAEVFGGLEAVAGEPGQEVLDLPREWLEKLAERVLSEEEKALVQSLGGWDKLMETLRQRLAEQEGRHMGGSKWIGTAGTSAFGAHGYNPEGVRMGQDRSRHRRAVKVWDRRIYRDLDDGQELGTRTIKIALRRLRAWAREGAAVELDLDRTITKTAQNGYLDVQTRPERRNAVKVLLLLDVGGTMDEHVGLVEQLFSAARAEFKNLDVFYFHNCVYEGVWRHNLRRHREQTPTDTLIRTYPADTRLILVGDAAMSPVELTHRGGAVEHWNDEPGAVWLARLVAQWPRAAWINPVARNFWSYTPSTGMIARLMGGRMFPMTLAGLDEATRALQR